MIRTRRVSEARGSVVSVIDVRENCRRQVQADRIIDMDSNYGNYK